MSGIRRKKLGVGQKVLVVYGLNCKTSTNKKTVVSVEIVVTVLTVETVVALVTQNVRSRPK